MQDEMDTRRVEQPDTPDSYEFGFFEFDIRFPPTYPLEPPSVRALTTNAGRTRFNPNIYAEGKVCLSILGTWRGTPGEDWSSAQGLESLLLSIQSLLSPNPYENEPGYEEARPNEVEPAAYIAKIRHETLRLAVLQRIEGLLGIREEQQKGGPPPLKRPRLDDQAGSEPIVAPPPVVVDDNNNNNSNNNTVSTITTTNTTTTTTATTTTTTSTSSGATTPATDVSAHEYDASSAATLHALESAHWEPFADLLKRRFLWYYDTYHATAVREAGAHEPGSAFARMQFEYPPSNTMDGTFHYPSLLTRLARVRAALTQEENEWVSAGAKQVTEGTQLATQLAFQFRQLAHRWNDGVYAGARLEIRLPDPTNPFRWSLTFFGPPLTDLDGGIFALTLTVPPTFPAVMPRVRVETPIFHHRVSTGGGDAKGGGSLCYFPAKQDDLASHLEGVVAALEDKTEPQYDPRAAVNPEAFALYWGGGEKRKVYARKLRRSAQESCEF